MVYRASLSRASPWIRGYTSSFVQPRFRIDSSVLLVFVSVTASQSWNMGSIVLKSLSVLLGIFFVFVGTMKLTSHISKDLHKDLVSRGLLFEHNYITEIHPISWVVHHRDDFIGIFLLVSSLWPCYQLVHRFIFPFLPSPRCVVDRLFPCCLSSHSKRVFLLVFTRSASMRFCSLYPRFLPFPLSWIPYRVSRSLLPASPFPLHPCRFPLPPCPLPLPVGWK